jgi:hypothetical protein
MATQAAACLWTTGLDECGMGNDSSRTILIQQGIGQEDRLPVLSPKCCKGT